MTRRLLAVVCLASGCAAAVLSAQGLVTSKDPVRECPIRIATYEERLNGVIAVNPEALGESAARDAERARMGVSFTGRACSEPRLLALAYAFEQATKRRVPPKP